MVEQQPPFAGLDGRRASAEHADEAVPIGHHGAVEDPGHVLQGIAPDDGVLRIPPDGSAGKGLRPLLPGHIGYCGTYHFIFAHFVLLSLPSDDAKQLTKLAACSGITCCYLCYYI